MTALPGLWQAQGSALHVILEIRLRLGNQGCVKRYKNSSIWDLFQTVRQWQKSNSRGTRAFSARLPHLSAMMKRGAWYASSVQTIAMAWPGPYYISLRVPRDGRCTIVSKTQRMNGLNACACGLNVAATFELWHRFKATGKALVMVSMRATRPFVFHADRSLWQSPGVTLTTLRECL